MNGVYYEDLARKVFSFLKDRYMNPALARYAFNKKIVTSMSSYGTSYSTYKSGVYYIALDEDMLYKNVHDPSAVVINSEFKDVVNSTLFYLMGLFYHEFGHVLFTSFDNNTAFSSVPNEHIPAVHYLFNVLEDPFIEIQTKVKIRKSRKFFNFLVDHIFKKDADKYTDGEGFLSFAQYLLLVLRLGKTEVKNSNQFYDDHVNDIAQYVKKFYSEVDGSKRAHVVVEFYEYLKAQGMDFDVPVPKEDSTISSAPSGGAPASGSARSAGNVASSRLHAGSHGQGGRPTQLGGGHKPLPNPSASGTPAGTGSDSDGDEEETTGTPSGGGDITSEEADSDSSPSSSAEDYEAPTEEEFTSYDEVSSGLATHEFVNLKELSSPSPQILEKAREYYDNTIVKFSDVVSSCMEKIDSFSSINAVYPVPGYSSGKFSVKTYTKGEPLLKCFTRPSGPDIDPDLCFYILVDGSGSMSGSKSSICTQAMMILYECLSRLSIPFELSTFTDAMYIDDHCYTYVMKSFDEDPELNKSYLTFSDSLWDSSFKLPAGYSTFCSNYDEVNVAHCGVRLLSRPHRNKVMVVLSDGYTCGSTELLRDQVKVLESQGVLVLGVGICSDSVEEIYDKRVIFSNSQELKEFPEFLGKFLVDLYTE